jgi:hypothetical protein
LPQVVTLVGSMQTVLGCAEDWQPSCAATALQRVGGSTVFAHRFAVPKGGYELKVALNRSWDESYSKDGGGDNIPLVLQGPATLDVSYDHATHRNGIEAAPLARPVSGPTAVSVPGDHNSEMGCAGDWAPDCTHAQLTLDPHEQVWKGTYTIPAAEHAYKAAIDETWNENYGDKAVPNGANMSYTAPAGPVTFYYDHATHYVTSDAQGPIVTAPGSFQSELGCAGDWDLACMRPWLQDVDVDGVFTWSTSQIPAGRYKTKAAHGLSWGESYGAGGAKDGANIPSTSRRGRSRRSPTPWPRTCCRSGPAGRGPRRT